MGADRITIVGVSVEPWGMLNVSGGEEKGLGESRALSVVAEAIAPKSVSLLQ